MYLCFGIPKRLFTAKGIYDSRKTHRKYTCEFNITDKSWIKISIEGIPTPSQMVHLITSNAKWFTLTYMVYRIHYSDQIYGTRSCPGSLF